MFYYHSRLVIFGSLSCCMRLLVTNPAGGIPPYSPYDLDYLLRSPEHDADLENILTRNTDDWRDASGTPDTYQPYGLLPDSRPESNLQPLPNTGNEGSSQDGLVAYDNSLLDGLPSHPDTSSNAHFSLNQEEFPSDFRGLDDMRIHLQKFTGQPAQSLHTTQLSQVKKLDLTESSSGQQKSSQNLQGAYYDKFPFSASVAEPLTDSLPDRIELQLPIPKFESFTFTSGWQSQGQVPTEKFRKFAEEIQQDNRKCNMLNRHCLNSPLVTRIEPLPIAYVPPEALSLTQKTSEPQQGIMRLYKKKDNKIMAFESIRIKRKLCILMTAMYNYHALYLKNTKLMSSSNIDLQDELFAWFKLTCREPRNSLAPLSFASVPPETPLKPSSFGQSQILIISFLTGQESFEVQDTAICLIATFYKTRAHATGNIATFKQAEFWKDMKKATSTLTQIGTKRKPGPLFWNTMKKIGRYQGTGRRSTWTSPSSSHMHNTVATTAVGEGARTLQAAWPGIRNPTDVSLSPPLNSAGPLSITSVPFTPLAQSLAQAQRHPLSRPLPRPETAPRSRFPTRT